MVLPPFFEGPTDDQGIVDFYSTVSEAGLSIIGYNVPQAVGVEVTPDLFRQLSEIPNFVSVKDSSGDLAAQASLTRTGLPTMNGADRSEEHTSELQSLMRNSSAVFSLKKTTLT